MPNHLIYIDINLASILMPRGGPRGSVISNMAKPGVSEDEIREIRDVFDLFDPEGTGEVRPKCTQSLM